MTLRVGDPAPAFSFTDQTGAKRDLGEIARSGKPVVLAFLRYAGCPLCQLETARLGQSAARFGEKGATLLIVTQSRVENLGGLVSLAPSATFAADPWGEIYRLYNVRVGTLLQYAGASILTRAREASAAGYAHGAPEGQERQLPAAFVIAAGRRLAFVYYGKTVADAADPEDILKVLDALGRQARR